NCRLVGGDVEGVPFGVDQLERALDHQGTIGSHADSDVGHITSSLCKVDCGKFALHRRGCAQCRTIGPGWQTRRAGIRLRPWIPRLSQGATAMGDWIEPGTKAPAFTMT